MAKAQGCESVNFSGPMFDLAGARRVGPKRGGLRIEGKFLAPTPVAKGARAAVPDREAEHWIIILEPTLVHP